MQGLSLVAASGGHSSSRCTGLSLSWPLLLRSTGSRCAGSVVVAHGPSCSAACGIFPDQGSNPCPLHWQADSQPVRHQGSPLFLFLITKIRDFPGSPAVKTPHFQCRGHGFDPWSGNWDPASHEIWPKNYKKRKSEIDSHDAAIPIDSFSRSNNF